MTPTPATGKPQRPESRPSRTSGMQATRPLAGWRQHHRQCLEHALLRLIRRPVGAWATILVVAIVLSLPGLVMSLGQQISRIGGIWVSDNAQFNVYLHTEAKPDRIKAFADWLDKQPQVASIQRITPAQGLKSLKERLNLHALDEVNSNPLPTVFVVHMATPSTQVMLDFRQQMLTHDVVDSVSEGGAWIKRLEEITRIVDQLGWLLMSMLGLTVLFVVGNTLRLELQERKNELALISLIGGTRRYMLRPLLYDGLVTGLAGGLAADLLIQLVSGSLAGPINHFAASYGAAIDTSPPARTLWLMLVFGGLLGWLGAQVIGRYYIRKLTPP